MKQGVEDHGGNAMRSVSTITMQYVFAFSHDGAPYGIEAEAGTTSTEKIGYPTGLLRVQQ